MILQIIFILLLAVFLTLVLHIFILPVHICIKGEYPFSSGVVFNLNWGIGVISGCVRDEFLTVRLYGIRVLNKPLNEEKIEPAEKPGGDSVIGPLFVKESIKPEEKESGEEIDYLKVVCFIKDNILTGELCGIIRLLDLENFHTDIRIGLDDPEATGKVYGYLMAISGYLYSCRNLSLNAYPSFEKPAFELFCSGRIKIRKVYRIVIFAVKIYMKMRSEGIVGKKRLQNEKKRRGDLSGDFKGRDDDRSSKASECPV